MIKISRLLFFLLISWSINSPLSFANEICRKLNEIQLEMVIRNHPPESKEFIELQNKYLKLLKENPTHSRDKLARLLADSGDTSASLAADQAKILYQKALRQQAKEAGVPPYSYEYTQLREIRTNVPLKFSEKQVKAANRQLDLLKADEAAYLKHLETSPIDYRYEVISQTKKGISAKAKGQADKLKGAQDRLRKLREMEPEAYKKARNAAYAELRRERRAISTSADRITRRDAIVTDFTDNAIRVNPDGSVDELIPGAKKLQQKFGGTNSSDIRGYTAEAEGVMSHYRRAQSNGQPVEIIDIDKAIDADISRLYPDTAGSRINSDIDVLTRELNSKGQRIKVINEIKSGTAVPSQKQAIKLAEYAKENGIAMIRFQMDNRSAENIRKLKAWVKAVDPNLKVDFKPVVF